MDDLSSLLSQAFEVFKTLRDVGLAAGLLLLVNMLVNLTKLPWVERLFEGRTWVRALLALGLGAAGGVLTGLLSHMGAGEILMAGLNGLLAGLGAIGLHETVQSAKALRS